MNWKRFSLKALLPCLAGVLSCTSVSAQDVEPPVLRAFSFNDQSCVQNVSDNGVWAVSYGPAASNTSEYSNARLINTGTGEVTVLGLEDDETTPLLCMAGDVSDDGLVVGMYKSVPAYWTKDGGWHTLDLPPGWTQGWLESVTPDGKYAVGKAYTLSDGWREQALMYDLTSGELLETPGIPTKGSNNEEATSVKFTNITPDGRYISGIVDYSNTWNTLGFIYDRQEQTYSRPGFNSNGDPWADGVTGASGTFSPDGKWFGGTAYVVKGTTAADEYEVPFRYNMATQEFIVYDDVSTQGYECVRIDNEGIIYACTSSGSPIRSQYILVDKIWYPLDDLLKLRYGIDFYGKTGYDNTGSGIGVSGDGTVLVGFPDPYNSYTLKMNETFASAARGVNLLQSYTAIPADGAAITKMKTVSVTFKYDVQIAGSASDLILKDSQGNTVKTALSFTTESTSKKVVSIGFRTTILTAGEEYTLTIPAGTIVLDNDASRTNEEIVLHYTGRAEAPVTVTKASPENGATLTQLDVSTNPVFLTYDTDIKLADGATALLYRDGETEPLTSLNLATSTKASESKMVMVYPVSTVYLFLGSNYKIVVPAGAVTDINGDNACGEYSLDYEGLYERVIVSDNDQIYSEDFSNGVNNMLLRDGDGNTPDEEMQGYDFQEAGDSYAWVPVLDDYTSTDFAAASTSSYDPAGQSDDWMVTPQVYIPDGNCRLDFDAQGFRNSKTDKLKVIIYADETVYNYLDEEICTKMRTEGEVLMDEVVLPGSSEDQLAGDWTTYSFKLGEKYAGKSVYVAFVNENEAQSLVFVDNIKIIRDTGFLTALTSATTVVNAASMEIKGRVIANSPSETFSSITVKLLDSEKNVVDEVSETGLALAKGDKYDFTFARELPLTVGESNKFYFAVQLGEYSDEVAYTIKDLAFQPVKRVVIEENTGMTCGYCPLGHQAWEYIENLYNDKVMMASYHTYNGGDLFASGMTGYVQDFLGLTAAPTAKINRGEVTSPMYLETREGKNYYLYSAPDGTCWLDMIQKELETDADADLSVTASYDAAAEKVSVPFTAKFAMNMEKQNIGLLLIVTENGLVGFQDNNFGNTDPDLYDGLTDWCSGGVYGASRIYPFTHNEVVRAQIGSSYYGTTGYIPSTITSGEEYTDVITFDKPEVGDITNCKVICMMIDANTGRVINNAKAQILDPTGIGGVSADAAGAVEAVRYNAAGQVIPAPQKGLNIIKYSDGTVRKVIVK